MECGLRIVAELSEDDRGASGASFELPTLGEVLDRAEAEDFDVLLEGLSTEQGFPSWLCG